MKIAAHDPHIHIFAVSDGVNVPTRSFLTQLRDPDTQTNLPDLFGHPGLDDSQTEVFAVNDIEAIGLRTYLHEAYDIPHATLSPEAAKLDALGGHVIVLTPAAVGRMEVTLSPHPTLTHIASLLPKGADIAPRAAAPVDLTPITPDPALVPKPRVGLGWIVLLSLLLAAGLVIMALR